MAEYDETPLVDLLREHLPNTCIVCLEHTEHIGYTTRTCRQCSKEAAWKAVGWA